MTKQLLFVFALISTLVSCRSMKDPIFKGIENVKMNELNFNEPAVTLDMRYHNPNNFKGLLKQA